MAEPNYRQERIERLLQELRYEVERGMMQGEIDESLGFRFIVPMSKSIQNGVVFCEFRTRPRPSYEMTWEDGLGLPKLRIVK